MSRRSRALNANGTAIRAFRHARGLSALQVVDALRTEHDLTYSRASLYNIELGHKNPSPELLHALAAVLRIPTTAILNDTSRDRQHGPPRSQNG